MLVYRRLSVFKCRSLFANQKYWDELKIMGVHHPRLLIFAGNRGVNELLHSSLFLSLVKCIEKSQFLTVFDIYIYIISFIYIFIYLHLMSDGFLSNQFYVSSSSIHEKSPVCSSDLSFCRQNKDGHPQAKARVPGWPGCGWRWDFWMFQPQNYGIRAFDPYISIPKWCYEANSGMLYGFAWKFSSVNVGLNPFKKWYYFHEFYHDDYPLVN